MDSGDSGSLQSSSGAEEECDSRAAVDSFSSFITNNNRHHQPPQHQQQSPYTTNPTTMFDPLSNFFINQAHTQNHPLLNLDSLLSHPHANIPAINPFADFQSLNFTTHADTSPNNPFPQSIATATPTPTAVQDLITTTPAQANQQLPPPPSTSATSGSVQPVRNPKKRSRASRRAPTTVLTTDTTNFRAMVQQFTGTPAPPFASSSPFPRTRLDLFATPSSIRSNPNVAGFHNPSPPQPPPYLLRPFAQKLQPPSSASPSSSPLLNTNASSNMQSTLGNFLNNNISSNDNNNSNNSNQNNLGLGSISSFLSSKSQEGHGGGNDNGSIMKIGAAMDEFGLINSYIVSTSSVGNADNIANNINNTNINQAQANWAIGGGGVGGGQRVQATTTTSTTNNF